MTDNLITCDAYLTGITTVCEKGAGGERPSLESKNLQGRGGYGITLKEAYFENEEYELFVGYQAKT